MSIASLFLPVVSLNSFDHRRTLSTLYISSFLSYHSQTCIKWLFVTLSVSDQDRISPYNISTISSRQVMRIIKEKSQVGDY